MSLNLRINVLLVCISLSSFLQAQPDSTAQGRNTLKFLYDADRQKLFDIALSYQMLNANENDFIGRGLEGKDGYTVNARFFIYKQFFIGYAFGSSRFEVTDPSVIGNINSTQLRDSFFHIGYEFLPLNRIRAGVTIIIDGEVDLIHDLDFEKTIRDSGNVSGFGFSLAYELSGAASVFCDYTFRTMKTDIQVPNELNDLFSRGRYQSVSLGLRFAFGHSDLVNQLNL